MTSGNTLSPNYTYNAPQTGGDIKGFNPDYSSIFGTQNANQQSFTGNQLGNVSAFQGAHQAAVNALPTYQELNQQNNARYNVQPLAEHATNLNNQILRLPSENYGMTQGSDTSQGQLDQMTGVQQFRLAPLAQSATAEAQTAQNLSNQATGYGIQNEAFQTSPYTTAAPMVQNVLASAATNFGQAQADQLKVLQDKVDQGVTLTKTEMDNLTTLKAAQTLYNQNVDVANITGNYATNKYVTLQPSYTSLNTQTGKPYRA
jgi:hypothetical protein